VLFILLPGVPLVITLATSDPVWIRHPFGWLLLAAEALWVLAAGWLVIDNKLTSA
jgi:hypothetical protein